MPDHKTKELFHQEIMDAYRKAIIECGYAAHRFLQMVAERGALQTAKDLLHDHDPKPGSGFLKLGELNRLDLTVEAVVLKDAWKDLFTPEELAIARKRIQQVKEMAPTVQIPESTGNNPIRKKFQSETEVRNEGENRYSKIPIQSQNSSYRR